MRPRQGPREAPPPFRDANLGKRSHGKMIIARLMGGLGNQMFQYSMGRTLALKHGDPLRLDCGFLEDRTPRPRKSNFVFRSYDLDIFGVAARAAERGEIPPAYRLYLNGVPRLALDGLRRRLLPNPAREESFSFDPRFLELRQDAYLEGYWQSPKYFHSIADTIRDDFKLKSPMSETSLKLLGDIRSCNSVCINVRRTDFLASKVHGTIGEKYYHQALGVVAEWGAIDHIYVFSDDMEWCESHLSFGPPVTLVGHDYAGSKFGEYHLAERHVLGLLGAKRHLPRHAGAVDLDIREGAALARRPDEGDHHRVRHIERVDEDLLALLERSRESGEAIR